MDNPTSTVWPTRFLRGVELLFFRVTGTDSKELISSGNQFVIIFMFRIPNQSAGPTLHRNVCNLTQENDVETLFIEAIKTFDISRIHEDAADNRRHDTTVREIGA